MSDIHSNDSTDNNSSENVDGHQPSEVPPNDQQRVGETTYEETELTGKDKKILTSIVVGAIGIVICVLSILICVCLGLIIGGSFSIAGADDREEKIVAFNDKVKTWNGGESAQMGTVTTTDFTNNLSNFSTTCVNQVTHESFGLDSDDVKLSSFDAVCLQGVSDRGLVNFDPEKPAIHVQFNDAIESFSVSIKPFATHETNVKSNVCIGQGGVYDRTIAERFGIGYIRQNNCFFFRVLTSICLTIDPVSKTFATDETGSMVGCYNDAEYNSALYHLIPNPDVPIDHRINVEIRSIADPEHFLIKKTDPVSLSLGTEELVYVVVGTVLIVVGSLILCVVLCASSIITFCIFCCVCNAFTTSEVENENNGDKNVDNELKPQEEGSVDKIF